MATQTKNIKNKKSSKKKERFVHGSAAPLFDQESEVKAIPVNTGVLPKTVTSLGIHSKALPKQSAPSVSLFAIVGFFVVATLMIFVMLAQVNYNEVLRETARLNTHLDTLKEQQRVLSITFESVINMDEIERYAKDVLGMSKPEAEQVTVIRTLPYDRIEVIEYDEDIAWWLEFGDYLTFLFEEYIR